MTARSKDLPEQVLAAAVRLFPAHHAHWGLAMTSELAQLETTRERRRFTLGCVRAILLTRPGPGEPGRRPVTVVTLAALTCLVVVTCALLRYPGLRTGAAVWLAVTALGGALVMYELAGIAVIARLARPGSRAMGLGLGGGAAIAAVWLLVGAAAAGAPVTGLLPVVLIPLTSLTVGAAGAWHGRSATTGTQVALLAALIAGLMMFLCWVGVPVLTGGHPYDPGMVRDYKSSGAPDLATYAVNDSLGAGMMLLLLVPTVTILLGDFGSHLAIRFRRSP